MKYFIGLVTLLACAASAAAATNLTVNSVSIKGNGRAYIHIPHVGAENVLSGRVDLGLTTGGYIEAFCVDVYHNILAGTSTVYPFVEQSGTAFTTDFGGHAISDATRGHIFALVNAGTRADALHADADQQAIWALENKGYRTVTDENGFGASQAMVDQAVAYGLSHTATNDVLLVSTDGSQSFAAQTAVPEPATWAMMFVGLGAVGAMMRRRSSYLTA